MTTMETIAALSIAAAAMYGLGIPLAWLLPAPTRAQWIHRIAIGPLYAIVLTTLCAWALRLMGIPLHPLQLVALLIGAWWLAWWRTRQDWRVREAVGQAQIPALIVTAAGAGWWFSLIGYGLYLPNRDFKNHAYYVAQVAFLRTSDSRLVTRALPVGPPEEAASGYPLGLHTLLGWALPTSTWNAVGVTAAAAVLGTAITLPLALVTLARLWDPDNTGLATMAGFAVVAMPGVAAPFNIGAVPLLMGTGFFATGLVVLWRWLRRPGIWTTLALLLGAIGLLYLHIAEAVALGFVALCCLPAWAWQRRSALTTGVWAALALAGTVALGASLTYVRPLLGVLGGSDWENEPNTFGLLEAALITALVPVSRTSVVGLIWLVLVLVGLWVSHRRGLSYFPVVALAIPIGLGVVASGAGVPPWLRALSAPWYGAIGRVSLIAAPSIILLGCLTLSVIVQGWPHVRARGGVAVTLAALVVTAGSILLPARELVPMRRASLAATLAGAGDSPAIARQLADRVRPGGTVLNFEGDGGALLFPLARVPIVLAFWDPENHSQEASDYEKAIRNLARVEEPEVAAAMSDLGVEYVVVGTSSLYWNRMTGYSLPDILQQRQFSVALRGSELTVLRYRAEPAS